MKLLISTQVYENYAWQADGSLGVGADAHWKAKGGNEYVIKKFRGSMADATLAVMAVRRDIECDNPEFRETIINWSIVQDDFLTEFERNQLEYEGKIIYPCKELAWA